MTQYGIKKVLHEFGNDGSAAVLTKIKQLDEMSCIKSASNLTPDETQASLRYLMFLKE